MVDKEIKNRLMADIRERMDLSTDISDDVLMGIIANVISEYCRNRHMKIDERKRLSKELFDSIRGFDVIGRYLDDPEVTEIMINGKDCIFIEKNGEMILSGESFECEEKLEDVIQKIAAASNRTVTEADPIVDARLKDGSRACAVLSPPASNGAIVSIRKFSPSVIGVDDLIESGTVTREAAEFLTELVAAGYNCLISGGTSSGKTTFLNAFLNTIGSDAGVRVITIEDSAELRVTGVLNLVSLESRVANSSGCKEITIRDLIKTSLRLRPERLIIGEVRGAEALDMLMCLNTGHDGSMCTIHSNSAADTLSRLEVMVLMAEPLPLNAIRRMIASGIDILVHLERDREGKRRVVEITEISGVKDEEIVLNPIFSLNVSQNGRELVKVGMLQNVTKIEKYFNRERAL